MEMKESSSFWDRFGVSCEDAERCIRAVQDRYPGFEVTEFKEQGRCSFTFLVRPPRHVPSLASLGDMVGDEERPHRQMTDGFIVQIRPAQHALDLKITQAAKDAHPALAPRICELRLDIPRQLRAYEMEKLNGIPLSRLLLCSQVRDLATRRRQERLVESFASFVAQSWHSLSSSAKSNEQTHLRADSPMDNETAFAAQCKGKVGSSIVSRLEMLVAELPDPWLRYVAACTLRGVLELENWPVVLNHGDLIPSNILVDEETWEITGVVDWAEAENLPLGMCLYGLEHMLGYFVPVGAPLGNTDVAAGVEESRPGFVYYNNALDLRALFWERLMSMLDGSVTREDLETNKDAGVLLWYGIAWDDGAINRVVNEVDDAEEVAFLRAVFSESDRESADTK